MALGKTLSKLCSDEKWTLECDMKTQGNWRMGCVLRNTKPAECFEKMN